MDVTSRLSNSPHAAAPLSRLADGVVGSEILRIAGQVRALVAAGTPVCNLTVGDFNPAYFPIPDALLKKLQSRLVRWKVSCGTRRQRLIAFASAFR